MNPNYYLYWQTSEGHCNFKEFLTKQGLNDYLSELDESTLTYIHIVSGFTLRESN